MTGGEVLQLAKRGYYMAPTLIADTAPDMRINCEEVFGPVASTVRVKDYEEALDVANRGAVRRHPQIELRRPRAGLRGDRILHADQDGLHRGLAFCQTVRKTGPNIRACGVAGCS